MPWWIPLDADAPPLLLTHTHMNKTNILQNRNKPSGGAVLLSNSSTFA